jgi:DNA modification methylase
VPFVDSIVQGDCRELLPQLPDECLDAVITSPPYYQQRDYGVGDIGNEPSLDAYIQNLLQVFEQCVRCLKPTGSIFFNIGDKYERRFAATGSLPLCERGCSAYGGQAHQHHHLGQAESRTASVSPTLGQQHRADLSLCQIR